MYKIDMFVNIFSEGEILAMSETTLLKLERLLDDKMSYRMLEFFDRFEASGIRNNNEPVALALSRKVDRMKELLGHTIKCNTFHQEVMKRNVLEFVNTLNVETALEVVRDRDAAIETLEWLLDNRRYWKVAIDERRKEDFDSFLDDCTYLIHEINAIEHQLRSVGYNVSLNKYDNLTTRIKSNKEFFYAPNERKRSTRMGTIMHMAKTLEIVLHGLKFQKECDRLRIRRADRRLLINF